MSEKNAIEFLKKRKGWKAIETVKPDFNLDDEDEEDE